jgi:hypothetical protein
MTPDDQVLVVLRVSGDNFEVDAFLDRFPELEPSGVWRRGERSWKTAPPSEDSGFNLPLIEGCSRAELADALRAALDGSKELLEAARHEADRVVMDIGLMIEPDLLATSLRFDVPLLRRLAELEVALETSVYLCGPDEGDDEEDADEEQEPLN